MATSQAEKDRLHTGRPLFPRRNSRARRNSSAWGDVLRNVKDTIAENDFQEKLAHTFKEEEDASDTERIVHAAWRKAESLQPTDPYGVLRAPECATMQQLDELYRKRLQHLGCRKEGVDDILRSRVNEAHALLTCENSRSNFDSSLHTRRCTGSWARIEYPNGFYEGDVMRSPRKKNHLSTNDGSDPLKHGRGVLVMDSGEKFEGSFQNDLRHGEGIQMWVSGDVCIGQWVSDQMHGLGTFYSADGDVYVGAFDNGHRHGRGRLVLGNGSVYKGEFYANDFDGHGSLSCVGSPRADSRNSQRREAELQSVEKDDGVSLGHMLGFAERYVGSWRRGIVWGEGLYVSEDRLSYRGQFVNGQFHGAGAMRLANGDNYVGEFKKGVIHGRGLYSWEETDEKYDGNFDNGVFCGDGRMEYTENSFPLMKPTLLTGSSKRAHSIVGGWRVAFIGQWNHGFPNGRGRLEGGSQFDGEWKDGLRHGSGVEIWPGGTAFRGHFVDDQRHGESVVTYSDGAQWKGKFVDDVRHGGATFTDLVAEREQNTGRLGKSNPSKEKEKKLISIDHEELWHFGTLVKRSNHTVRSANPVDDLKALEDRLALMPEDDFTAWTATSSSSSTSSDAELPLDISSDASSPTSRMRTGRSRLATASSLASPSESKAVESPGASSGQLSPARLVRRP
eukprot:TRINITY_DN49478_c0_g1_i1.p1 TRINITY_DN49478_c0_g1~~TRINITY_DN49478_c0_g1_i1.p1  ORF type:complete len:687 (-),score=83.91 TRINITY_DN49478_c0_g1_i1:143-2167(-)